MKTVIVPIDFSETSINALQFAANFLKGSNGVKMILYHAYSKAGEAGKINTELETARTNILSQLSTEIEILAHHEDNFVEGLERAVRHRSADLVIMGSNRKSAFSKALFDNNFMKFCRTKACPVLVIPEQVGFTQVKNVMLASDFQDNLNTTPSGPIKDFLSLHRPQLHVVNVDKDHYISLTEKYESEKQHLKQLLQEYNPEFYFMRLFDIMEAIELFSKDRVIDLIIIVQREQTILKKLFSSSTPTDLAHQSLLPILVIHQ